MDNDSNISCSECKFYFSLGNADVDGECRKNPPIIIDNDVNAVFPVTNDLLWCGDFARDFSIQDEDTLTEESEYGGPFDYEGNKIDVELSDDIEYDDASDEEEEMVDPWSVEQNRGMPPTCWGDKNNFSSEVVYDNNSSSQNEIDDLKFQIDVLEQEIANLKLSNDKKIESTPHERIGW
jgi:hypothetical protein